MAQHSKRGMFTVSVGYGPSTVLIACSGPATITELSGALLFGCEIARRTGRSRFLFDILGADFEGTDEDREELGQLAAGLLGTVERVAVVLAAEVNTGVGEQAAREAGLELRNFEGLGPAMDWLTR